MDVCERLYLMLLGCVSFLCCFFVCVSVCLCVFFCLGVGDFFLFFFCLLACLPSCRRILNFRELLIFHGVMYHTAQNDDAKLAIRGQTLADSKCFLLRKSSLFLGTSFVLLC